jgi:hypothetical protein
MALVTSHQQPAALVVALDRLGLPGTVAGLPLPRHLEILSSLEIPVVEGDAAGLQDDLANARRWLNANP